MLRPLVSRVRQPLGAAPETTARVGFLSFSFHPYFHHQSQPPKIELVHVASIPSPHSIVPSIAAPRFTISHPHPSSISKFSYCFLAYEFPTLMKLLLFVRLGVFHQILPVSTACPSMAAMRVRPQI